jgi:hypothetical protein
MRGTGRWGFSHGVWQGTPEREWGLKCAGRDSIRTEKQLEAVFYEKWPQFEFFARRATGSRQRERERAPRISLGAPARERSGRIGDFPRRRRGVRGFRGTRRGPRGAEVLRRDGALLVVESGEVEESGAREPAAAAPAARRSKAPRAFTNSAAWRPMGARS